MEEHMNGAKLAGPMRYSYLNRLKFVNNVSYVNVDPCSRFSTYGYPCSLIE